MGEAITSRTLPDGDISQSAVPLRLDALLKPRSIAFVGASPRRDSPGNTMMWAAALDGYAGRVYAINPKYGEVEGVACFPNLKGLPETVEHVVLGLANEALEDGLDEAIVHGARAATIFASCDLGESGDDALGARLTAKAKAAGVEICGGNGMGFLNPQIGLRVSGFAVRKRMKPGRVAFITQSGSAFSALTYNDQRLKFSICVSSGREFTTTAADYLDWALDQPSTRTVGLFIETVRDPASFVAALEKAQLRRIPIVALKVGRTELGAGFAASHSGAIAGNTAAYEAVFERYGVFAVDNLDDLAAHLLLFSCGREAGPGGLVSLHDSGGEREMVADLAAKHDVSFAAVSAATLERLRPHLDAGLQPANPLDVWGTGRDFENHVEACLATLLEDDQTSVGVLFQDIRSDSYIANGFSRAVLRVSERTAKPLAIATNFAGVDHRDLALKVTEQGVPVIDGTEEALKAIKALLTFRDAKALKRNVVAPTQPEVIGRWRARLGGAAHLDEAESLALLSDYGISVPRLQRAASLVEVVRAAAEINYPVALKTAEPGIDHKSDFGGVLLNLPDENALVRAYADLCARLGPNVLVAEMAPPGIEVAFGLIRDPQFGTLVILAAGGVWIEVLQDRVVALPGFGAEEALRLIDRLRLRPLFDGRRGRPPADIGALAEALSRFSILAADLGDLIAEMDVNPLIVSASGCMAVDALIVSNDLPQRM